MIPERFIVRGKRVDDGELVEGYYRETQGYDCETLYLIHSILFACQDHEADPATVEPVAVRPLKSEGGSDVCPNCNKFVQRYEQFHGKVEIPYCKWCGQRLDWTRESEGK